MTGCQDGSVSLWEWGHQTAVATPRPPGTFAKVTRVRFSQHGNKFGVADSDGHLSLFQVACREGTARPFFVRIYFITQIQTQTHTHTHTHTQSRKQPYCCTIDVK